MKPTKANIGCGMVWSLAWDDPVLDQYLALESGNRREVGGSWWAWVALNYLNWQFYYSLGREHFSALPNGHSGP